MRKYPLLWVMLLLLTLCACGDQPEVSEIPTPSVNQNDPNLGVYYCTSVKMDDLDIGSEGQWIQLTPGGRALITLMDQPDEGTWDLNGIAFTLTLSGAELGTGTLQDGVLTLDLMGAQCVFTKIDIEAPVSQTPLGLTIDEESLPDDPEDLPPEGYAYLSSYGSLYRITYPMDLFRPSDDGLTDLVGRGSLEGTLGWTARLATREAVDQWKTGLAAKTENPKILSCENLPLTIGDTDAQVVVYQDASGWHSNVLVVFGRDKGTKTFPMYAACLSFSGPSREAVWCDTIQTMAASLTLTP